MLQKPNAGAAMNTGNKKVCVAMLSIVEMNEPGADFRIIKIGKMTFFGRRMNRISGGRLDGIIGAKTVLV
jgi:hypothetical protein